MSSFFRIDPKNMNEYMYIQLTGVALVPVSRMLGSGDRCRCSHRVVLEGPE